MTYEIIIVIMFIALSGLFIKHTKDEYKIKIFNLFIITLMFIIKFCEINN